MTEKLQLAICQGCSQSILLAKTRNGKSIQLDPPKLTIVTEAGDIVSGRITHFATCQNARDFVGKKTEDR